MKHAKLLLMAMLVLGTTACDNVSSVFAPAAPTAATTARQAPASSITVLPSGEVEMRIDLTNIKPVSAPQPQPAQVDSAALMRETEAITQQLTATMQDAIRAAKTTVATPDPAHVQALMAHDDGRPAPTIAEIQN